MAGLLQSFRKSSRINDSEGAAYHVLADFDQARPCGRNGGHRPSSNKGFPPSVQEFGGDDSDECAAHQGSALSRADKLFTRNCVEKFQKTTVEIGITSLVDRL